MNGTEDIAEGAAIVSNGQLPLGTVGEVFKVPSHTVSPSNSPVPWESDRDVFCGGEEIVAPIPMNVQEGNPSFSDDDEDSQEALGGYGEIETSGDGISTAMCAQTGATANEKLAVEDLPQHEDPIDSLLDLTGEMTFLLEEGQVADMHATNSSDPVAHEGIFEEDELRQRAGPRARFIQWCASNREWVEMAVDFAIRKTVMERLMKNLKAPFTWVTVQRNLIKYSGFCTAKFLCCQGHQLFDLECSTETMDQIETEEIDIKTLCSVCVAKGTLPRLCSFEHFPLLPRIRKWVLNEESASDLYNYRHSNCLGVDSSALGNGHFFGDYFDGTLYRDIIDKYGGEDAVKYDIFITLSSDGFQPFYNRRYDCWPIVALNMNLAPCQRFLMRNVIPFGFTKGPQQPVLVDSFIGPLVEELKEINEGGGTPLLFHDGVVRKVRVHVLWVTGDLSAIAKLAGVNGSSGKCPCHYCKITGVRLPASRRYYFPSQSRIAFENEKGRSRLVRHYDPVQLKMRNSDQVKATFRQLRDSSSLSRKQRSCLSTETGVKRETRIFEIPSIVPFYSFPLDTMHLGMNITRDMLELFKGENLHLGRLEGPVDDFVISECGWKMIDMELEEAAMGTPSTAFGSKPRDSSCYGSWKAAECKSFILNYCLVVFDGHLPQKYLTGLKHLSALTELYCRPSLTRQDKEDLQRHALQFFMHYERDFFRLSAERLGLCKFTIHLLLHLADNVDRCGPLVNFNQFWVERYIGFIKNRLTARSMASEALAENAKLFESYKMFFDEHFVRSESPLRVCSDDQLSGEEDEDGFEADNKVLLLGPRRYESLNSRVNRKLKLRDLLDSYIRNTDSLSSSEADAAMYDDKCLCFGKAKVPCGEGYNQIGSLSSAHERPGRSRADYYVSVQFLGEVDHISEDLDSSDHSAEAERNVFYGRVLKIVRYEFRLASGPETREVIIVDWATQLRKNSVGQVYGDCKLTRLFRRPTATDVSGVLNSIGVLEHVYPRGKQHSRLQGTKTFILDPYRRLHSLLSSERASPDGYKRMLAGLV